MLGRKRKRFIMIVGITGLGLIGGSFAKSIKAKTHHTVFAADIDANTITDAKNYGAIDKILTPENISECNLVFLAIAPSKAIDWLKYNAEKISVSTIVIDLCGTKRAVCEELYPLARKNGFIFIGGHPMAGLERSGFENSTANLFDGASMVLTPDPENILSAEKLDMLKAFFSDIGFASVIISTPEEHDRIIAYTSQLAHVISSAYVKFPDILKHCGFSAGSFADISRTAGIDEKLWTELFLYNRDFLIEDIEALIKNINEYLCALKDNDSEKLEQLLRKGREMKALAGVKK